MLVSLACLTIGVAGPALAQDKPASSQPADKVFGWRGDGTGKYPTATPPTEWTLNDKESKNILWKIKLPCYSWATPLIIGDKLITRSDPYDLICLDKNSGKLLWIRSHPAFIAVTAEEKKTNSAWKEIETLVDELQKLNDQFVEKGWAADLYQKKHDLQQKINDLTAKADKKYEIPPDKYVESWSGYTGTTPACDGKYLYFNSGNGVTACYDLDGKVKWAKFEDPLLMSAEHGMAWSAGLVGDKLVIPQILPPTDVYVVYARNKDTGELAWKETLEKGKYSVSYSTTPFKIDGQDYCHVFSNVFRASDGKHVFVQGATEACVPDGNDLYCIGITGRVHSFRIGADLKVSGLKPEVYLPLAPGAGPWDSMQTAYVASPLYHDGLLYCVSCWGWLSVIDVAKSEVVYTKMMPFDFKNPKSRKSFGMGMGSSPALGGKYIYMTDSAGCTIVIEPGRTYKQVAKNNIDYTVPSGWEVKHWMGAHHEQTEASLVFESKRIYLRGEQFMYCVGEK